MNRTSHLALVLAVTLGAGGLHACNSDNAKPGEATLPPAAGPGAPPPPALPALTEDRDEAATATVGTTGTTYPRARAEVGPPLSGVIASIEVDEGDRVKKGQVLFRLRTTDLALGVDQARAAAASANVGLVAAQTEYDRARRLFDQKALEQAQLDRVTAQLEAARAVVAGAKVGVSRAQQVMGDAVVRAPIGGVVTHKLKNDGEMATMMPPTVVVVVEDHAVLELRFRLPEARIASIAVDQPVVATFSATGQRREAKVARVAPSVDPMTRTVEVIALIDNADGALRSGMLANVTTAGEPPAAAREAGRTERPVAPAGKASP